MELSYEVKPKIVPQGGETEISIRGVFPENRFDPEKSYTIRFFSKVDRSEIEFQLKPDDEGILTFSPEFKTAGEYQFDLFPPDSSRAIFSGHLFALKKELCGFKPFKGDLHIHTLYSDGRQSPIYMAVTGKRLGLDFIAITDHDKFEPSLEAIKEAERIGLDMLLIPGEEVSARELCGHYLSINASGWVAKCRDELESYDREITLITRELKERELVRGLSPQRYAHAVWVVNKIRELGGFAVIAHPYWVASRRFHLDRLVYEQLLSDGLFDAIELLGDVNFEDNVLSVARYQDELSRGRFPPIIGNSDTHRAENHTYGRYWSVVFAEELSIESVLKAISDRRSVACQRYPNGQMEAIGPFHLVEYTYFLEREFFPIHDRICELEGMLFMRMLEGRKASRGELDSLKAELRRIYDRYWAS